MSRINRFYAVVLFALLMAVTSVPAAPAPLDNSPLAVVPDSAPLVFHVRGVEGTKDRFIAMLKNALPELAPRVESFLDSALKDGELTDGRKFQSLVKNGPIFGVFTELPKPGPELPKVAILFSVTKYEDFRDNTLKESERKELKTDPKGYESTKLEHGGPIFFVNRKEYVVVTPSQEVAIAFTRKQSGLNERMSKEQAAKFLAGDISVYLSMDSFNKEYADQIQQAKEAIRQGLQTTSDTFEKSQRSPLLILQKLLTPIFQAVEDSQGVLFTVEFRPGGLALHWETEVRPGTPTNKILKDSKVSAFKGLNTLPAGQIQYSGIELGKYLSSFGGLVFGITPNSDSEDKKEGQTLQSAVKELIQAKPGTCLSASNLPPQGLQITHFDDPAKAVEAQLKLIQALTSGTAYSGGLLKDKPKLTPKAGKYDDFEFTSVELTWDLEKMVDGASSSVPMSDDTKKEIMEGLKKVLGVKQTSWIGTNGKMTVEVTAKDWPAAEKILDHHFKGTDTADKLASFSDVRKELPAEASVIALMDVVRYLGANLDSIKPLFEGAMALPFKLPQKPAKVAPTYVGTAITMQPERGGFDLFISAPSVHELYKAYIQPVIESMRGGGN